MCMQACMCALSWVHMSVGTNVGVSTWCEVYRLTSSIIYQESTTLFFETVPLLFPWNKLIERGWLTQGLCRATSLYLPIDMTTMPGFLCGFLGSNSRPYIYAASAIMTAIPSAHPTKVIGNVPRQLCSQSPSPAVRGNFQNLPWLRAREMRYLDPIPAPFFYTRREERAHLNGSSESHCTGIWACFLKKRLNHKIEGCFPPLYLTTTSTRLQGNSSALQPRAPQDMDSSKKKFPRKPKDNEGRKNREKKKGAWEEMDGSDTYSSGTH